MHASINMGLKANYFDTSWIRHPITHSLFHYSFFQIFSAVLSIHAKWSNKSLSRPHAKWTSFTINIYILKHLYWIGNGCYTHFSSHLCSHEEYSFALKSHLLLQLKFSSQIMYQVYKYPSVPFQILRRIYVL